MHSEEKEAAFSIFFACKSFGAFAYFAMSNVICVKVKLIVLVILYALGLPSLLAGETLYNKRSDRRQKQDADITENMCVNNDRSDTN